MSNQLHFTGKFNELGHPIYAPGPAGADSLERTGSDFGCALLEQHMIVMTTLGRTCRMNGGDLKDPAVIALIDKADALDRVAELWGIELNPND